MRYNLYYELFEAGFIEKTACCQIVNKIRAGRQTI